MHKNFLQKNFENIQRNFYGSDGFGEERLPLSPSGYAAGSRGCVNCIRQDLSENNFGRDTSCMATISDALRANKGLHTLILASTYSFTTI